MKRWVRAKRRWRVPLEEAVAVSPSPRPPVSPSSPHVLNDSPLLRLRVAGADFLGGDFGLEEEGEIVAPAGLRVRAAHVEAAEGVRADERACALAVEVEVADVELAARALQLLAVVRVDRAGQAVLRVVGDAERVVEVVRADAGEDGAEDFFLLDAVAGLHVGDDGRLDEEALLAVAAASRHDAPAVRFALLDVVVDGLEGFLVDDGAHRRRLLGRVADQELRRALDDALDDWVVAISDDDCARAGRALLPLEAEGGGDDARRRVVEG